MKRPITHTVKVLLAASAMILSAAPALAAKAFKVEVTGQGLPLILIPGLASSGEVWQGTVKRFCGARQCHVLTLAGFAGQPAIEQALLPAVEEELAAYISANKLEKPVIVGHSLGGFVALKLASDHPDKVGRLVIVDSLPALGATQMPDITLEQLQSQAARMRDGMLAQDEATRALSQKRTVGAMVTAPADAERIIGWGQQSDRKTVASAMYQLMSSDLRGDLARIKAPTLVLGTWIAYKDYAPRAAIAETFKAQYAKLGGAQIELADTARHFVMYDDPEWMYTRMEQFLK
ncbi:alpha/beta fold hydrolase [Pseudoduganella violacea]|uniref:Pimeloyl-ACP methyl ester carboxylesterase n=1 Tax=Pseudoduganella violacea TaxID=1715466 RepID=A0A7W5BFU6_9BURK|nr:alpha/beta hydrolase [Pseudoduganella violacea]MBB3122394.1 pimeloyl-ACP methyl ester carboxylesterase [Pseudoduganella violacea]